ncbi:type II CAAX endopeptidase family protein [Phytohabitans sp. ZYX-F-186]|uniref:Type II CAAX endopeptidase family protein n=1 Tax=Phytohabitans maris TaxID=3071409 RepID=A0ABU0ZKL4_9ACTN|nr:type II CAAX endopeptidase family protein [Phytohabitans sp. ZYX-F-186]MDQ7907588.1 type II CAAX endopeptidase family protein [Phytohabitans sp. ZYX-F-186]
MASTIPAGGGSEPGSGITATRPAEPLDGPAPAVPGIAVGSRYHRLAGGAGRRRWATAVAGILVLAGGLVLVSGSQRVARWLPGDGLPLLRGQTALALLFLAEGLFLPLVLVVARWVEKRPAGTVLSVQGRVRCRWLGWCLVLTLAWYLTLATVTVLGGSEQWVGWQAFAGPFTALAAAVVVGSAGEELVFRGLLLQAAGRFFSQPWPAILIQAVLWTAMYNPSQIWAAACLLAIGITLGWLTIHTGGPEAAIAWHAAQGVSATVLGVAFWDGGQAPTDQTSGDLTAGPAIVYLLLSALIVAALYGLARTLKPTTTYTLGRPDR